MTLPLIGITTYGRDENNKFFVPADYVDCVRRARGVPVLIPQGETRWEGLLASLNGILLSGGGDIDPSLYGGSRHENLYMVDGERDSSELSLARHVVKAGLPTFGICRGIQVANIALGGTLMEHLPDVMGGKVVHRLPERKPSRHSVTVLPGTRLERIISKREFDVASWHHQAIRRIASPLKVAAQAPDGVIEAAEMPDHPWFLCVQWHPELTAKDDPLQQKLFDAFVKAAGERRGRRRRK